MLGEILAGLTDPETGRTSACLGRSARTAGPRSPRRRDRGGELDKRLAA